MPPQVTEWSISTQYRLCNQVSGVSRNTTARQRAERAEKAGTTAHYVAHSSEDSYPVEEGAGRLDAGIYVRRLIYIYTNIYIYRVNL